MEQYIRLLEEISLNAWPSQKMELYDGWLIRYSNNYTHRTNCINLVAPSTLPWEEKVKFCEQAYKNAHTPIIFKISPFETPKFDLFLSERGYIVEHTTEVMTTSIETCNLYTELSREYEFYQKNSGLPSFITYKNNIIVQLSDTITDDWITNLFRLNGTTNPTHLRVVPAMYKAIPKETIVCQVELDGRMVASGLGILDRNYVGIYAIYVDVTCRKRNFARSIITAILTESKKRGATHAYLQVVHNNESAKHLYCSLGFDYFYTYWFRTKYEEI